MNRRKAGKATDLYNRKQKRKSIGWVSVFYDKTGKMCYNVMAVHINAHEDEVGWI